MQYRIGTISVTNGSNVVNGVGTTWLANVLVNQVGKPNPTLLVNGGSVVYTIAAVNSNTQLQLSVPYAGSTASGVNYSITKDFTANLGLAEINEGDRDWAVHLTEEVIRKVDVAVATGGGGSVDISGKEDKTNKDTDVTLSANSNTKYPSQKAVKTYVDKGKKPLAYYTPTHYIGNPIIDVGAGHGVRDVSKIVNIGGTYHMYGTYTPDSNVIVGKIAHWSAPTVYGPWTMGSVVIDAVPGSYYSLFPYTPEIVVEGSTIYMFFVGSTAPNAGAFASSPTYILLATASTSNPDGPFTVTPTPILSPAGGTAWDGLKVGSARPLKMPDGSWRLYYKGQYYDGPIKYRKYGFLTTSAANFPFGWTRYSGNPIFGEGVNGSTTDDVDDLVIERVGDEYYVLTSQFDGVVTSGNEEDGMWYKSPNGIDGWSFAPEMPNLRHFVDLPGTTMRGRSVGFNFGFLDGELSAILVSGNTDDSEDFQTSLFPVVRSGSRDPAHTTSEYMVSPVPTTILPVGTGALSTPYIDINGAMTFRSVQPLGAPMLNLIGNGQTGVTFTSYGESAANPLSFRFKTAKGTESAPRRLQTGNVMANIGALSSYAPDDSTNATWSATSKVVFRMVAAEDHTATAQGTEFHIEAVPKGSTSLTTNLFNLSPSGLTVGAKIESTSGGFKFPDTTVQTTAFTGLAGSATQVQISGDGTSPYADSDFKYNAGPSASGTKGVYLGITNNTVLGVYGPATYGGRTIVFGVDTNAGYSYFGDTSAAVLPSSGSLRVIGDINITGDFKKNGVVISGGAGAVSSVFSRTGAIVAASGDYTKAQVTGLADTDAVSFGGVTTTSNGSPVPLTAVRTSTATNTTAGATTFMRSTTADMVDGFGVLTTFSIKDSANVENAIGQIGAVRAGADNTGDLIFKPFSAGTSNEKFRISSGGFIGITIGATVASATTITPTGPIFHVTGTTAIATINIPYTGFNGQITIIPDGIFTTTTAGNIALASTAVVSKALIMTYDATAAKWYPSY